jgi:UDP-N-acetylmuramoyl-tripeptide--D-alanyl-D-alanine ligase
MPSFLLTMADWILTASVFWIGAITLQAWRLLLFFQQEEYDSRRFLRWAGRRSFHLVPARIILVWLIAILAGGLLAAAGLPNPLGLIVTGWLAGGTASILTVLEIRRPAKIQLAYTLRIYRLLLILLALTVLLVFWIARLAAWIAGTLALNADWGFTLAQLAFGLLLYATPLWIIAANLLLFPVEKAIQYNYLGEARRKIRRLKPLVVGITGSYGKTSTKEILAHILSAQKNVLATPKSYNTLLGVSKVINTSLQPKHEIFIVEMGAYRPGEIADICGLVRPQLGTITAVGPQHLERFGTVENIAKAKFELIEALPETGTAFFNADDAYTDMLMKKAGGRKVIRVGIDEVQKSDLAAEEIRTSSKGLTFTIVDRRSGERMPCSIRLLGRHNVANILIASAIAKELGMSLRTIAERVNCLAPIQHRLQLLERANGVNVIDDAYNSNPVGARNALEALGSFEEGRKILVTPGMVELGPIEPEANYELGQAAASVCDLVILVGAGRTAPIREGLLASGFHSDHIKTVPALQEGIQILDRYLQPKDTVLFLNDLPDLYSEMI